jgi:membrane fusion protein (multidrug efflux system)
VVNQDNKVELRELKADRTIGNQWLINEGLNSGDRLITEGLQFVKPGDEVSASEASNVQAAKPVLASSSAKARGQGE